MLSSIHPFGERSRNNSFWTTAGAHILGSTLGGAAFGLLAALVGLVVTSLIAPTDFARLVVVLVASVIAFAVEITKRESLLPTRSRQVDENWMQTYRGWVYGAGWGAELGFGISTIITTAMVHLLAVTMVLSSSPATAIGLGVIFGFTRGITILASSRVDTPERLRTMHRRLDALRDRSRAGVIIALAVSMALGLGSVI